MIILNLIWNIDIKWFIIKMGKFEFVKLLIGVWIF